MKVIAQSILFIVALTMFNLYAVAEEDHIQTEQVALPPVGGGTPLTAEEKSESIGRYGEVEKIPDNFQYTEAENQMWRTDHLANIKQPLSLYYEFVKSGTYEEGFTDSVYLNVLKINDDGTKDAMLDFFTGERKQAVSPANVTHIVGNPVIGIYMQGDIYEMNRLTEGHWRHFQKQIKIALRNDAEVEPTTFNFNGKEYKGKKVYFSPYLKDPHRRDFKKFADKYYELIFSDEIPGSLYQITTIIPDKSKENAEPLIEEKLTLMSVKTNNKS